MDDLNLKIIKTIHSVFPKGTAWLSKLLLVFLLCPLMALPQKDAKKQLENRRNQLLQEIEYTRQELDKVREKKQTNLNELVVLKKQINTRQELIDNYQLEIASLGSRISDMETIIASMESDLAKLKAEYAKMLRMAYKNTAHYNGILFILSAQDFNQALQRLKYLQQYHRFRRTQLNLIQKTSARLGQRRNELKGVVDTKEKLKTDEQTMKQVLEVESGKKNQLVTQLQQNERELGRQLKEKEAASRRLNRAIEDMIRREIAEAEARRRKEAQQLANKKTDKTNRKGNKNTTEPEPTTAPSQTAVELGLTPEAIELSSNFSNNHGRLPWPVKRGFISESFGRHEHPVLKGVVTQNDGVNISTQPGESVRAVFKGKVTGIVAIPGMQKVVLIRHGEFLSVYAHLSEVKVRLDQEVNALQDIGEVYTDDEQNKTEVHLQIRKGRKMLNPADWLLNR